MDLDSMNLDPTGEDILPDTEEQLATLEISSPQLNSTASSNHRTSKVDINSIPPEVLGEIFEHFISDPAVISSWTTSAPMRLAQVCWTWRNVALSVPRLWSDVIIDCGSWTNMQHLTQAAHNHLVHSASVPVSIQAKGSPPEGGPGSANGYAILNLLSPYANRIQHLTLAFPMEWMNQFLQYTVDAFTIPLLETVTLVYQPIPRGIRLETVNIFTNAPRLRKFEIKYDSQWSWQIGEPMFTLPWDQITELNLVHFVLPPDRIPALLSRCPNLEICALTMPKEIPFEDNTYFPTTDTVLPNIHTLTFYNPKSYNYYTYLARIQFPALERLNIFFMGDIESRVGSKWEQDQLIWFLEDSRCRLRVLHTTGLVGHNDIESILGNVPSLVELDVLTGDSISASTLRLMCNGLLAPNIEIVKCAVAHDMLSDFLDMLDCRYVPSKSRAIYRGIRTAVISCDMCSKGFRGVRARLQEFKSCGRDVTVLDR